ncbi:MAG: potassium channel family protein [Spirulina sp.]
MRLLFTFLILSGIFAAKEERQIIRQVIAIGSIVLILDWIESLIQRDTSALFVIVLVLYSIFFIAIAVATLIEVLKSQRVTANIICGAIVVYLLIGLSAALLATLMDTVHLGSFLRQGEPLAREGLFHDLLYYSLVTLSTIGYGDITPNSPAAQSLSITLGLLGQIYLTVLVAMLVGKLLKE